MELSSRDTSRSAIPDTPGRREGHTLDPRARTVLVLSLAAIISIAAGVALTFLPPLLVVGALVSSLVSLFILINPFWGLLLYIILFMLRPGELYPTLAALHIERVIAFLSLAAMYFAQIRSHGHVLIDNTRQTRGLLLVLLAALLSVPFAIWRGAAMVATIEFGKIVAAYLLIAHLLNTRRRLRLFTYLFLALLVYIAASSLTDYLRGDFTFKQAIERARGQTNASGNPNGLANILSAAVPLFLLLSFQRALRWRRVLFASATAVLLVTIAVTGSRAGFLSLIAGVACLWCISRRRVTVLIIGIAVLSAGIAVLPQQYKTRYATITSSTIDESSQGRLTLWAKGLRMFADRPVFGVGLDGSGTANAMIYSSETHQSWLVTHNLYIQVLAELGLVGAIAFSIFLVAYAHLNRGTASLLRRPGPDWAFERNVVDGTFAGGAALLVNGMFASNLLQYTLYFYAALLLGVFRLYQHTAGQLDPQRLIRTEVPDSPVR